MKNLITILILICSCWTSSCSKQTPEVYIAGGAGYRHPVDEIKKVFEEKYNIKVHCIYGNMKQIISQSTKTKKVSVMVGDKKFLKKSGIRFKEKKPLGRGKLILVYHKNLKIKKPEDLLQNKVDRVLVPDSKKAIYGIAAHEVLKKKNLFNKVEKKIITVQTVPQVTAYLISGTAKVGFLNITDYLNLDRNTFSYIEIDQGLYSKITILCGLTNNASKEGNTLYKFMTGKEAQAIFKKYGLEN